MKLKAIFLLAGLFFCQQLLALNIYVSPKGNDSNPGTVQKPLATLIAARDMIRKLKKAGKLIEAVNVIFKSGIYSVTESIYFTAEDSGTKEHPISYLAEKTNLSIFTGGIRLQEFKVKSDGNWIIQVPTKVKRNGEPEQLFINGLRVPRSRYPDSGYFSPSGVTEKIMNAGKAGVDSAIIKVKLNKEQVSYFSKISQSDLHQAIVTFYHNWDFSRKKILSYSEADSAFYISGNKIKSWNPLNKLSSIAIENVSAALKNGGQWYYDQDGSIIYRPKPGEQPKTTIATTPFIEQFLVFKGSEGSKVAFLNFKGLSFEMTKYTMPQTGIEPVQAAANTQAAIVLDFSDNISFSNCSITKTGQSALWIRRGCSYITAEQCLFKDLGANAVKIGEQSIVQNQAMQTHHNRINNCIMQSGSKVFPSAAALIIFQSSNNTITHNDIADFIYTGISVGWTWGYGESLAKNNNISYNHIHHLGWGILSDMGGIYTLGKSEGTVLRNNVLHDIFSKGYGGWGLYTDEGSTGILLENNLVYNCKSAAFHQHYGQDNTVRNNIFYNQQLAQLEATRVEPHTGFTFTNNIIVYGAGALSGINWSTANFKSDYNLYWNTTNKKITFGNLPIEQWQKSGKDEHSVLADPRLINNQPTNKSALQSINFKLFNANHAGVYGDKSWTQKAILGKVVEKHFEGLFRR
ncbi:right-handed parallel beta-helix repeat-containing protein [Pedobacter sp. JCM 36344]|uniref:right-handed parallel beta-helix repeat-containing protein n=1 Tax=Pedobacter sp. JCM 36344 TaxID=3374280 RepID=UPI003978FFB2